MGSGDMIGLTLDEVMLSVGDATARVVFLTLDGTMMNFLEVLGRSLADSSVVVGVSRVCLCLILPPMALKWSSATVL